MKNKVISISILVIILLSCAFGLFFLLREPDNDNPPNNPGDGNTSQNLNFLDNISSLMMNTKLSNEGFSGFSLIDSKQNVGTKTLANNGDVINKKISTKKIKLMDEDDGFNKLICVNDNFETEEISFQKISSAEQITLADIAQYGVITQFGIMNNLLFIQITSNDTVKSDAVTESDYFTMGSSYAIAVVDLNTKNVYFLNNVESLSDYGILDFELCYGLIGVNLNILNVSPTGYYSINVNNDNLIVEKVAEREAYLYSRLLLDKYNNTYIINAINSNSYASIDFSKVDVNKVNLLTCDYGIYEFFISTECEIFRALKSSFENEVNSMKYSQVEKLQADGTWVLTNETSDKIIRNQLTDSKYFQGGDWLLINGNIVRIVYNGAKLNEVCYNIDGKILAYRRTDELESFLYIGDISDFSLNSNYINLYKSGTNNYKSIISEPVIDDFIRLNTALTRTGYILKHDTNSGRVTYRINVQDGEIQLDKVEVMYNGFEVVSDIIFLTK